MTAEQRQRLYASLLHFESQANHVLRMRGRRPLTQQQGYALWRRYLTAANARRPRVSPPPPPLSAPGARIPLSGSSGGGSAAARPGPSVGSTILGIANSPLVQGGLDAGGAIFGDPALGQQVAAAVNVIAKIAPVLEPVVSAVGSAVSDVAGAIFGGNAPPVGSLIGTVDKNVNMGDYTLPENYIPQVVVDHPPPRGRGTHTE